MSTKAFIFLGLLAAMGILCLALATFRLANLEETGAYPLDEACYALFDQNGREWKSWYPPVPAADAQGVFTFNNDHTWGYVFGPSAMVADRDCLRERGVDVPPLDE